MTTVYCTTKQMVFNYSSSTKELAVQTDLDADMIQTFLGDSSNRWYSAKDGAVQGGGADGQNGQNIGLTDSTIESTWRQRHKRQKKIFTFSVAANKLYKDVFLSESIGEIYPIGKIQNFPCGLTWEFDCR